MFLRRCCVRVHTACCCCCCCSQVNGDPYGAGWMIKVKLSNEGELSQLLSSGDYEKHCEH